MNVYHNLESTKAVACQFAKRHNCNYTIIIMNPDDNGNFSLAAGSTYEFVADSYWNKERPNVKKLYTTDELNSENKNEKEQ